MVFAPKIFLKRGLFTIPAIFGDLDQSDALTNLHAKGRVVLVCIRVANGGIVLQAMIYGIFPHKVDCLLLAFSFQGEDRANIVFPKLANLVKRGHGKTDQFAALKNAHGLHANVSGAVKADLRCSDVTIRTATILFECFD